MDTPIFSLSNTDIFYPSENGRRYVLRDISLSLSTGQHIGLFAPNGSGKTTLLRTITGLHTHKTGSLFFHGREISREKEFLPLRQAVGFVLQEANDQLFFPTVLEDVSFGPLNLGLSPKDAEQSAMEILERLRISALSLRLCHQLSGGEKRLVALAGVLAMHPEALLLDEPTQGLDQESHRRLIHILHELGTSTVVVSHDPLFLSQVTDTLLTIENSRLTPTKGVTVHTHAHAHVGGELPHEHMKD